MSRDVGSINRVILVGNVGQNPEIRMIPQRELKVAHFSLATKERSFNPNTRESKDYTEWHRIVVFGRQAEFIEKWVTQGKQLLVEGKLRTRKWQDRSGNQRQTTEIEAQNVVLLGRREGAGAPEQGHEPAEPGPDFPGADTDFAAGADNAGDDEIPF